MKRHGRETEGPTSSHSSKSGGEGSEASPFLTQPEELRRFFHLSARETAAIESVSRVYPLKIPRYYASLFDRTATRCPLSRQAIPSLEELNSCSEADPLGERHISLTPILLRRYENRAVLLVSNTCAMFCRFCNRKRLFKEGFDPLPYLEESLGRIAGERSLREVILSGGDPLMLDPDLFFEVLSRIKDIRHVAIVRVSSRVPVVFPEGLKDRHLRALRRQEPVWFVLHINHPKEVTREFKEAVRALRRSRCVLVSQTVLLRGVNDCPHILKDLFERLVVLAVKPYYLFHLDPVMGTEHFKVGIERGIEIMRILRATATGLAIPHYVVDIPGGLGKVPLEKHGIRARVGHRVHLESPIGGEGVYIDDAAESSCLRCGLCRGCGKGVKVKDGGQKAKKKGTAQRYEAKKMEVPMEISGEKAQDGGRNSYDLK